VLLIENSRKLALFFQKYHPHSRIVFHHFTLLSCFLNFITKVFPLIFCFTVVFKKFICEFLFINPPSLNHLPKLFNWMFISRFKTLQEKFDQLIFFGISELYVLVVFDFILDTKKVFVDHSVFAGFNPLCRYLFQLLRYFIDFFAVLVFNYFF